jgi:hypothetical protein
MSGTCGMWRIGVFVAASCNISINMYIPAGAVEGLHRSCCALMPAMLAQASLTVGAVE